MLISNLNQALNFLYTAALGFSIGMLYDLFAIFLVKGRLGRAAEAVFDIIFWLIATSGVFFLLFCLENAGVEWYLFLGLFLGLILYFLTFRTIFRKIILKIIEFALKLFKILLTPLRFLLKMVNKVIQFLIMIFMKPIDFLLDRLRTWAYAVITKFRRLDFRRVHKTAILPRAHRKVSRAGQVGKKKQ